MTLALVQRVEGLWSRPVKALQPAFHLSGVQVSAYNVPACKPIATIWKVVPLDTVQSEPY